jgi:hypothetical protein
MAFWKRPVSRDYAGIAGVHLVRLERERARMVHEQWVHRPQFVGVAALAVIGFACVVGVVLVALIAPKGTDLSTAVSVLGSVAAASVGGVAGMLTGHSRSVPPAGQAVQAVDASHPDQPEGCSEEQR